MVLQHLFFTEIKTGSHRAVFNVSSVKNSVLFAHACVVVLHYYSVFGGKNSRHLLNQWWHAHTRFPALEATYTYVLCCFEFWLVYRVVCVCYDWSESWLLWCLYNTQLKTALKSKTSLFLQWRCWGWVVYPPIYIVSTDAVFSPSVVCCQRQTPKPRGPGNDTDKWLIFILFITQLLFIHLFLQKVNLFENKIKQWIFS